AVVSAYLANEGKHRYLWVTLIPMAVVFTTTSTAAVQMTAGHTTQILNQIHNTATDRNNTLLFSSVVQTALVVGMLACTLIIIIAAAARILRVTEKKPVGIPVAA